MQGEEERERERWRESVRRSDRKQEEEEMRETRGLRGPRVDVEEFRGDGKSKGPVRERPSPFEV